MEYPARKIAVVMELENHSELVDVRYEVPLDLVEPHIKHLLDKEIDIDLWEVLKGEIK